MKIKRWLTGVNLIAAIVLVNVFLSFYQFLRIDLSQNRVHSLSAATKRIVGSLDDVVNIKVFLTADLPSEAETVAQSLKTTLAEIERLGKGKIKLSYLDPNKDETAKSEAERLGVEAIQFSTLESDKFEVRSGYFGLAISYGGKDSVLPVAGDSGNLEYLVMSMIKELTDPKEKKIVVVNDSPEETEILSAMLDKNYKVTDKKEAGLMLLINPSRKMEDKDLAELDDWLAAGKGLIILADRIEVNSSLTAKTNENDKFFDWLKNKGIEIETKLVMDKNSAIANFSGRNGNFLTRYPFWIMVSADNIDSQIPAVSGLSSLTLAWAQPIKTGEGVKKLFGSSRQALAESQPKLAPGGEFPEGEESQMTLGAIRTEGMKLAVISDADFIKDQFLANNQQNLVLVFNLIDYFFQDNDLLSIRSKLVIRRQLATIDDNSKILIRGINLAAPVLILGLSYLIFRIRRKNEKKRFSHN